jgi:hypothetical protein
VGQEEIINAYKILSENLKGSEDNIKQDHMEMGCEVAG